MTVAAPKDVPTYVRFLKSIEPISFANKAYVKFFERNENYKFTSSLRAFQY